MRFFSDMHFDLNQVFNKTADVFGSIDVYTGLIWGEPIKRSLHKAARFWSKSTRILPKIARLSIS